MREGTGPEEESGGQKRGGRKGVRKRTRKLQARKGTQIFNTQFFFKRRLKPGQPAGEPEENAYFLGFGGEHINFFVRLSGRLGQPDPDQSEKLMFICAFCSLKNSLLKPGRSTFGKARGLGVIGMPPIFQGMV